MNQHILWQAVFVVWREGLEAILIIGILNSYLVKTSPKALPAMWRGVTAGVFLSFAIAALMLSANSWFTGNAQIYFQVGILFLSCGLMTQMVFWMRKHAKSLKKEVEANLQNALKKPNSFGIATVAALAVGREGSEAVIYIYGFGLEKSASISAMSVSVVTGLVLAGLMFYLLSRGLRLLKNQIFFNVTSWILLLSAAGLGASGIGKLVAENMLPGLIEPVWDISKWLDPEGGLVTLIKAICGYNPRPTLSEVLFYFGFWILILFAQSGIGRGSLKGQKA